MEDFDAITVPLKGSNLIEASAGTGKTYSIAILLLRLVVEQQFEVREILMVTFTKAAVAELQERVQLFIRSAYRAARGEGCNDPKISELVEKAIEKENQAVIVERLRAAVLLLDETAVMTIHSFCQQTLGEFAFETGQLFGAETLKDPQTLIEEEVNRFWRAHVTTIKLELLHILMNAGLNRKNIGDVLKAFFSGKAYVSYDASASYSFTAAQQEAEWVNLEHLTAAAEECRSRWHAYIALHMARLQAATQGNRYAVNAILPLMEDPDGLLATIAAKRSTGYISQLYPDLVGACDEIAAAEDAVNMEGKRLVSHLYHMAASQAEKNIDAYKLRNGLLSFDDMIVNLHRAAMSGSADRLKALLQKKFKAVFVDEFQDTDRLQYELFERFFGQDSIVFYIGDPKQSIYAFRKADIFTYFKAARAVDKTYSMNTNYRSSPELVSAMNSFFQPAADFDAFHFGDAADGIHYIPVAAQAGLEDMGLYRHDRKLIPMVFFEAADNNGVADLTAAAILDLLSDRNYHFRKKGVSTPVSPASIGVLVRTGFQGRSIKNALGKRGIPAVTIDDATVMDSPEAKCVLQVLTAFEDTSRGSIHKALLNHFTGLDREQLLALDSDLLQEQFKAYGLLWEKQGIYVTLSRFYADYRVKARLMNDREHHGERVMTNLVQLTELLHKVQTNKQLVNIELINWLNKAVSGMEVEGDEYEQRVENDEEAIKIITIHKSKGLEYPVVFAPFLDLTNDDKREFCSFRDQDREEYLFAQKAELNPAQQAAFDLQQEQENRRLLYVAVTRAAFQLYIVRNTSGRKSGSSLSGFYKALKSPGAIHEGIAFASPESIATHDIYHQANDWQPFAPRVSSHFELADLSWNKLSYTYLAAAQPYVARSNESVSDDVYEHFIFKQLRGGITTGNFLHYIFEKIDFTADTKWLTVISEAVRRFLPALPERQWPMIEQLVRQALDAVIVIDDNAFKLKQISWSKKISEFEFDFPVGSFNSSQLNTLSTDTALILADGAKDLSGIMNGKVDLFFEHGGKYYILDWKSNFLGDQLTDYDAEGLSATMNERNYHLQYQIYTLALFKYLSVRIDNFDYEEHFGGVIYLFIRGLRGDQRSGVFTYRPALAEVLRLDEVLGN